MSTATFIKADLCHCGRPNDTDTVVCSYCLRAVDPSCHQLLDCEICGATPAELTIATDTRQLPGDTWLFQEAIGRHSFCPEHRRESTITLLDGRVVPQAHAVDYLNGVRP